MPQQLTLFDYVNQLVHNEDGSAADFQALNFLKKYVGSLAAAAEENQPREINLAGDGDIECENRGEEGESCSGNVVESEAEAKEINSKLTPAACRAILALLVGHIQNNNFRKTPQQKDLLIWLQQPNKLREYLFYKVNGLKALVVSRGVAISKGRKSADDLRNILAGMGPPQEVEPAAQAEKQKRKKSKRNDRYLMPADVAIKNCIQEVLEKSFLPHRKGDAREHCSLGHRLEVPILKSWVEVVHGEESPVEYLNVKGAYSAGLAAKQGKPYIKDSIDFLVTVQQNNDPVKVWGFEAKGRVTATTAAAEEQELHYLNHPHVRIPAEDVFFEVAAESERYQVLQHAVTYNLDTVVLAISDNQSSLIRSTIIDFSTDIKEKFERVLEKLMEISLKWAYPSEPLPSPTGQRSQSSNVLIIPPEVFEIGASVDTINGNQALQGTANLWHKLTQLPKPFPSFLRLIPAIYAYWNAVKGGSDTTTKLMDDCIIRIPKCSLNPESVAVARLIHLLIVLLHRLIQVFSANSDITIYPDLMHYRKAASKRSTYHQTLLQCNRILNQEIEKIHAASTYPSSSPTNQSVSPLPTRRRRNPSRQLVDGVRPQPVEFGPCLATITPRKINKMVEKGRAPLNIESMVKQCTGMPMKAYPVKYNRCERCKTQTAWYCAGCKRWLCLDRRALKDNSKSLNLYSHTVKGKERTFSQVCFHLEHEEAWTNNNNNNKNLTLSRK